MCCDPFSSLRHLRKVPGFLQQLKEDIRFLRQPDLPNTIKAPAYEQFPNEYSYLAAVEQIRKRHKMAVVREAVIKTNIRACLWRKLYICYLLPGPLTVLFNLFVGIVWFVCIAKNPHILNWISPAWWIEEIQWRLNPPF